MVCRYIGIDKITIVCKLNHVQRTRRKCREVENERPVESNWNEKQLNRRIIEKWDEMGSHILRMGAGNLAEETLSHKTGNATAEMEGLHQEGHGKRPFCNVHFGLGAT